MSYSDIQAQFNIYSLQCFPVGKASWPKDILGKTELSRANSLIPCIPAINPLSHSLKQQGAAIGELFVPFHRGTDPESSAT